MSLIFNVFGSASSSDRDVLVFLDKIPSLPECKLLAKEMDQSINDIYGDDKLANTNFAVVKDGVLSEVFKGTVDEVNNSLYQTYYLHDQRFAKMVVKMVPRNKEQKLLRVARILLAFYSRTSYRTEIKLALHGDLYLKLKVLSEMDFSIPVDFGKNGSREDVYKNIAFQLGQILALYKGAELYSKEDIANTFSDLTPFLKRENLLDTDLINLEMRKKEFTDLISREIGKLSKLVE